jgi:hypothetical protein
MFPGPPSTLGNTQELVTALLAKLAAWYCRDALNLAHSKVYKKPPIAILGVRHVS